MTLSDKIWHPKEYKDRIVIHAEDVKEFIKDLKEWINKGSAGNYDNVERALCKMIDELAGDLLVQEGGKDNGKN